ncbi:hypothetical protein FHG87_003882 [Trinorchestia longiramus]|nr:hypothetical protein FHG87_003882 [Trinorchestia longiramus]
MVLFPAESTATAGEVNESRSVLHCDYTAVTESENETLNSKKDTASDFKSSVTSDVNGAATDNLHTKLSTEKSLLLQSQPSFKSRTSSPATAISQPNPNAPNPKPLTTLLSPLSSTPANPSPPAKHTLTITNQTHIKLTALIIEAHVAALDITKKFGKILTQSPKPNFNFDTTFPNRDSTAIFNFYYDKINSQQLQMTQTAPQEEHTIDQTIDTEMDETDVATYTEIRQKRRISDGMEDSKLLMDNKYTTYVKLYRNYEDSSPIPDNPTKNWFANELDKDQDNDKGLKLFTQDLDHQPVVETLRRRKALFLHTKINIIPHEQFITLPRYHTTTTTIKKPNTHQKNYSQ